MREGRVDHDRHGRIVGGVSRYEFTRFVEELLPFVGELQARSLGHDKEVYAPGGRLRECGVTDCRFFLSAAEGTMPITVDTSSNRQETMHPVGVGTPKGCIDSAG